MVWCCAGEERCSRQPLTYSPKAAHRTGGHIRRRVNDVERSIRNDGDAAGGVLDRRLRIGVAMTADMPGLTAESARGTGGSDGQARGANKDDRSARWQADVLAMQEPLYRRALHMTRNHADAEDLVQDTMMKAYAGLDTFRQEINLRGWMFRIMTNAYINAYRKQRRQPAQYPTGQFREEQLTTATHQSLRAHSAEQQALDRLGDSDIRAAMCALPEQFRLAVYYADVEGLRFREIADRMQTPVGTVTSRLHRGRRLLRQLLADVAQQRGHTTVEDAA
jgi:RNA polymerase sigma-70 factor, ECF subfamily